MQLEYAKPGETINVLSSDGQEVIAEIDVEQNAHELQIYVRRHDEAWTGPVKVMVA